VDAVPAAANAEHYANIVREKYTARSLIGAAEQMLAQAHEGGVPARELLDQATKLVFDIAEEGMSSDVMEFRAVLKEAFEQIDKWQDREGRLTGLETGFYDLDDLTSGLQPSELIVLAARPSMGKTSLALNIAAHVALKKKPVALFSLEMAHEQIARNILCAHARIDSHRLRRGRLTEAEMRELGRAMIELSEAPLFIDDTAQLSPMEIRAKARRLKSQNDIQLIIVDYLQLMESPGAESRQQEISMVSRRLKALARELRIPVLAVAQLNRGVEDRLDHKPRMSDLRESGSIEQDADVVALLHRRSYYADGEEGDEGAAELIIAKQRNGPTDTIKLTFLKHCMRFENFRQDR
jgi:replicative DNA helicase